MVFSRRLCVSSVRIIFVGIVLLFYTCQVHSQTSTDETTAETTVETSSLTNSVTTETVSNNSVPSTSPIGSDTSTTAIVTSTTITGTTTSATTPSTAYTAFTSFTETSEDTTVNVTDTTTHSVTTVTPICPGKFPFGDICISPGTNGGVVITAFILSIVSFIGVLGAASYTLFFRKYFSPKRRRIMTNYNVPGGQEMTKLKPTVSTHNEQVVGNRTKGKTQGAPRDQSSSQQKSKQTGHHQSNITDLDDDQF